MIWCDPTANWPTAMRELLAWWRHHRQVARTAAALVVETENWLATQRTTPPQTA
ncbi:MAG: hypothetical protein M3R71_02045 [Actinomycetota bacterium]|nr:hypothetical protein [Actinomycetota bacterium]